MGRGGGRSWVPPGELGGCGASDKSLGLENGISKSAIGNCYVGIVALTLFS